MNLRSADIIDLQTWRAAKLVKEVQQPVAWKDMTLAELFAAVAKIKAETE